MAIIRTTQASWLANRVRRERGNTRANVADALDRIVAADSFNGVAVAALATRDDYPSAVGLLDFSSEMGSALANLYELDAIAPASRALRAAAVAGVLNTHDRHYQLIDHEWLRDSKHPRALVALALLGECDWSAAPIEVRRAFVLRELVRAFRERAS